MTGLKELTWENHKKAETTPFMKRLAKRELSSREYYTFLANQRMMYKALEDAGDAEGLFDGLQSLKRTLLIDRDLRELEEDYGFTRPETANSTSRYINHISEIAGDRSKLLAHFYVRYFGDLSGGQILKRLVHGSAACYIFEEDVGQLKTRLASLLDRSMADEANLCFELMIDFLYELDERPSDGPLG
jgi:heme oxygenase (biliverdin-producing, ferredoxin)